VISYWLSIFFGFVNLIKVDNFGDIDEYGRMSEILKLILFKWGILGRAVG
jgi:hypothetical protein